MRYDIFINSDQSLTSKETNHNLTRFIKNKGKHLNIFISMKYLEGNNQDKIEEHIFDYLSLKRNNQIELQYFDLETENLIVKVVKNELLNL